MSMSWVDEHLKWDQTKYANISSVHEEADNIWKPDIFLYNSWAFHSEIFGINLNICLFVCLQRHFIRIGNLSQFRVPYYVQWKSDLHYASKKWLKQLTLSFRFIKNENLIKWKKLFKMINNNQKKLQENNVERVKKKNY